MYDFHRQCPCRQQWMVGVSLLKLCSESSAFDVCGVGSANTVLSHNCVQQQ